MRVQRAIGLVALTALLCTGLPAHVALRLNGRTARTSSTKTTPKRPTTRIGEIRSTWNPQSPSTMCPAKRSRPLARSRSLAVTPSRSIRTLSQRCRGSMTTRAMKAIPTGLIRAVTRQLPATMATVEQTSQTRSMGLPAKDEAAMKKRWTALHRTRGDGIGKRRMRLHPRPAAAPRSSSAPRRLATSPIWRHDSMRGLLTWRRILLPSKCGPRTGSADLMNLRTMRRVEHKARP